MARFKEHLAGSPAIETGPGSMIQIMDYSLRVGPDRVRAAWQTQRKHVLQTSLDLPL